MQCRIFGSLEIVGSDGPIDLGGRKRRALAAYLFVHHDRPRALERIVDDLWEGEPSRGADSTVQTYISRFRSELAPLCISKHATGYAFELSDDDVVDVERFEQLAREVASQPDASVRAELSREALDLWRDAPLAEFAGAAWADDVAAQLSATRSRIVERLADALLDLDQVDDAVTILDAAVAESPLDERFWALLVVAYARKGRPAEALRAVGRARQMLATELGIDPGPELRTLEQGLLSGDPDLAPRQPAWSTGDPPPAATSTGLVTFLMTDIVESTTLWDLQPAAMSAAVAQHERLVESAVTAAGGRLVKSRGEGDSTLSIFELASGAVDAAVTIVRSIAEREWSVEPPVRVRVSVHTGEAELRAGDFFGSTLSRAARLRALAGPNEVVCSRATAELVADSIPQGVRLVNRGTHTLRGLRRPEVVFALTRGDGPDVTPELPALTLLGAVGAGDAPIESVQLRTLLARLLVDRNRLVSVDQLTDALWGATPPATARNSLQSKISRLRALVGADRLIGEPGGYRLVAGADVVDADRFESLCAVADATTTVSDAVDIFDEALALWQGAAYGEFATEPFAQADAARLEAARRSAEDRRLELIAQRSADEAIGESGRLLARDPFRESAWMVKLRALAGIGRRVEALRAFHEYRTRLADETGLSPSPQLVELERALLEPEPQPVPPAPAHTTTRTPAVAERAGHTGMPWTGPVGANRPLAGRARELALLEDALRAAARGAPRLVMITGEAGIGKTRLLDEVMTRAVELGFETLRGSALTSGRAPLTALRTAIVEVAPELAAEISAGARTQMDAETADRVWSARALTFAEAVVERARHGPLLMAVDDVQSIDDVGVTALELIHASISDAATSRLPLLVVVTHRSIGAPADTLARIDRLARSSRASEIRLTGLDEPGLGQLVTDATSIRPTPELIDSLADASGNPLISLAFLQTFADAHALMIRGGLLDLVASAPTSVPFDVREVLASLVRDLDAETRAACVRIALLGDAQRLETVRAATGWTEEHLSELLTRAERAGLVKVDAQHVVFTHDLLRWSLVQSVPGSSRRRMHRELAEQLAPHVEPGDAMMVLLLAEQLRRSGDRMPGARIGYWSELAGDHCLALAQWSDAIRSYDAAAEASDTDDAHRAALMAKAGIASFHHHDVPRTRARLLPAIDELEAAGRLEEMGTAALVLYRAVLTLSADPEHLAQAREKLERFLELTTADESLGRLRARVLVQLAEATWGERAGSEREPLIAAARAAARHFTDDEMTSRVEMAVALSALTDLDVGRAVRHLETAAAAARRIPDPLFETSAIGRIAFAEIIAGAIGRARSALSGVRERQHSLRFWSELSLTETLCAAVATFDGDALGAAEAAREARRYFERSGYHFVAGVLFPTLAGTHLALGDAGGAIEAIETWRQVAPGGQWLFDTAVLALSGDEREARARLRARPLRVLPPTAIDFFTLASFAVATRIALALALPDVLSQVLPVVDALVERGTLATASWPTFLPQLAADVASALDEPDADERALFAADALRSLREG